MVTYILAILLLFACMCGCSFKETDVCVKFRTHNVESAQKVIPFTIILPNYLPSNLRQYPLITGPLRGACPENQVEVYIEFRSDRIQDGLIEIYECNYPFELLDPALNPDIKNVEIGGVEVRERETNQGFFGSEGTFSIAGYAYGWNQRCIYFIVEINGYDHDEAIKVVESMIEQM